MKDARRIFDFLLECSERGERSALLTLTAIIGSSSRALGAHMAVSEGGRQIGSFSGGCVEAAIAAEARRIIADGKAATLRFGAGSPFIDIRLPCGGGIDVLVTPDIEQGLLTDIMAMLDHRKPVLLRFSRDGGAGLVREPREASTGWCGGDFFVRHDPGLRLLILGHGEEPLALSRLATTYGADITVLSPEEEIIEMVTAMGATGHHLRTCSRSPWLASDEHSAIVLLFHDHDWEEELLFQALEQKAFFIGAMGSRATHARRMDRLRQMGMDQAGLDRLWGPIGLIPATRDPDTLALSIMAQIVQHYNALVR